MDESNQTQVVLQPLELSSSGKYTCEVSAEAPSFQTVMGDGIMTTIRKYLLAKILSTYLDLFICVQLPLQKLKAPWKHIWTVLRAPALPIEVHGAYLSLHGNADNANDKDFVGGKMV